jgi:alpha-L-arabinofuranosidase
MWNIGGWGNVRCQIEHCVDGAKSPLGDSVPTQIETGRWYDIRVELHGDRVRCFLDDKLVHDVEYARVEPLYVSAGQAGGDVVLKIANPAEKAVDTSLTLAGQTRFARATVSTLTSAKAEDENALDSPRKVVPQDQEVTIQNAALCHVFPPFSVTVMRFSK